MEFLTAGVDKKRPAGHMVARHSVFSGPRKHSGNSSNLKYPPTHHNVR